MSNLARWENQFFHYPWAEWIRPDDSCTADVPSAAGIYEVGSDCIPECLVQHGGKTILYVGMSSTLPNRFSLLASTWSSRPGATRHGSRKLWDKSSELKFSYPIDSLWIRWKVLVPRNKAVLDWYETASDYERGVFDAKRTINDADSSRKRQNLDELIAGENLLKNPRADIPFLAERNLIAALKKDNGVKPVLKTNEGDRPSPIPDDEFFERHFGDAWTEEDYEADL